MAAYRRVYGFGHLRADCRGPGSAPEPYAVSSMVKATFTVSRVGELQMLSDKRLVSSSSETPSERDGADELTECRCVA